MEITVYNVSVDKTVMVYQGKSRGDIKRNRILGCLTGHSHPAYYNVDKVFPRGQACSVQPGEIMRLILLVAETRWRKQTFNLQLHIPDPHSESVIHCEATGN